MYVRDKSEISAYLLVLSLFQVMVNVMQEFKRVKPFKRIVFAIIRVICRKISWFNLCWISHNPSAMPFIDLVPENLSSMMLQWLWAVTWENVHSRMCGQSRHKSTCACAQSDQSLRCPHEETLHPWLAKTMRPMKILIRLREWSESSWAHMFQRYILLRGTYNKFLIAKACFVDNNLC